VRRRAPPPPDPQALRELAADVPPSPGVYIFHGDNEQLPLYIGKSVNLRSRVLSHLRNPRERRMLAQTRRISHIVTTGEVGALLLEAQLIKERYPLLNKRLRRKGRLCSLRLQEDGRPEVVFAQDVDFARTPALHGLFTSKAAALGSLETLADEHRLCLGLLGLEKPVNGRPCFRSMLDRCAGACCGRESVAAHGERLRGALQHLAVTCWPHAGAVGLVERDGERLQVHVIRNWCYLGSADSLDAARQLDRVAASFDADSYKILCRPLLSGTHELVTL
jgi:excinuclease Cho